MTNTDEIEALRVELGKFKTLKENAELSAIEFQMSAEATEAKIAALEAVKVWPQVGDEYWAIEAYGDICVDAWRAEKYDIGSLSIGNVFPTEQAATDERDRRKVAAVMREMADGGHYTIRFEDGEDFIVTHWLLFGFSEPRFSTRELAEACLTRLIAEFTRPRLVELWGGK